MNHANDNINSFFFQTGRGVPVLIPNETKEVLNYLSNPIARIKANIKPENPYMFANTGKSSAFVMPLSYIVG